MKRVLTNKAKEIILGALVLLVILLVSLNSTAFFKRFDITSSKMFTISPLSREMTRNIPEQLNITYFISDKLKSVTSRPEEVEDMLLEYAAHSRGRIQVAFVDPDAEGIAAQVQQMGITPQPIEIVEENERTQASIFSGVLIEYLDRTEILPFVFQIETLEYELTRGIRKIVSNSQNRIGVVIGDSARTMEQGYNYFNQTASSAYEVVTLAPGETVPQDLQALIVLGGADLEEYDLFPVDQFVMQGGHVLFAIDGVDIDVYPALQPREAVKKPIHHLLENYGVIVDQSLVLDDRNKQMIIPAGNAYQILGPYPHFVNIHPNSVNPDHQLTKRFAGLDLLWPSPVFLTDPSDTRATSLFYTSDQAWLMEKEFNTNPQEAQFFAFTSTERQAYDLGYLIEGSIDSYFKGREIPVREGVENHWDSIQAATSEGRIMVVGDSDFLADYIVYSNSNYNLAFLQNVLEWLSNDSDLLEIKTRIVRDTRLNQIEDPVSRKRAFNFIVVLNLIIVPLLVIGFGIYRFIVRRKKSKAVNYEV